MKLSTQLYKKVAHLASDVKENFRSKGLIIPIQETNGIIKFDNYSVIRYNGCYFIKNASDIAMVEHINLAQTAILLANSLALGRLTDDKLLAHDRQYGYNLFKEDQYKRIASNAAKKKDWEKFDLLTDKQNIAHLKAEAAKTTIMNSFEKLRRIR